MAAATARTFLAFQHDAKLHVLRTVVTAVRPFAALEEANRQLFKQGTDEDHVVVTEQTIFHPQGGGQPSDVGTMTALPPGSSPTAGTGQETHGSAKENLSEQSSSEARLRFDVAAVRMDAVRDGQVLHFGRFQRPASSPSEAPPHTASSTDTAPVPGRLFKEGDVVEQSIDAEKRLLYSRLHTAGHVLGAAVRHLLEKEVPDFDELKASHFPGSAACEFRGLIDGARWREPIQRRVDEYVAAAMPVRVDWWDEDDFRRRGLERLIPPPGTAPPGEKFRVVEIVGAEVYPCGGTHVDTTDLCGETKVKKISRSKGVSRVSYTVS